MLKIVDNYSDANCITHSGSFHADEVFATAFLELLKKDIKVFRTPKIDFIVNSDVIVYDIGRGEFDHHQIGAKVRENNIPYSSFGLLWNKFGLDLLTSIGIDYKEEVFKVVDKDLIEQIDAIDNGVFPKIEADYTVKTISDVIKVFNPSFSTPQDENTQFFRACSVAKDVLTEVIFQSYGKVVAREKINNIISNNIGEEYIVLDEFIPYEDTLLSNIDAKDIKFVIYPSNRGGYAVKTVPVSKDNREDRLSFPVSWRGLEDKMLEKEANISGLLFCHKSGFLLTVEDLKKAEEVVHIVLNK